MYNHLLQCVSRFKIGMYTKKTGHRTELNHSIKWAVKLYRAARAGFINMIY